MGNILRRVECAKSPIFLWGRETVEELPKSPEKVVGIQYTLTKLLLTLTLIDMITLDAEIEEESGYQPRISCISKLSLNSGI